MSEPCFSRLRSPVLALRGCVASSQTLATSAGLAVAVAAALAVTEPAALDWEEMRFCLFYNAHTRQIQGLNGSGRSAEAQTLDYMESRGFSAENPPSAFDALNVTVPGAAACWCDTVQLFGSHKYLEGVGIKGSRGWADWLLGGAEAEAEPEARAGAELEAGAEAVIEARCVEICSKRAPSWVTSVERNCDNYFLPYRPGFIQALLLQFLPNTAHFQHFKLQKGVTLWEPPPNGQGLAALLLPDSDVSLLISCSTSDPCAQTELGHNSSDYIHVLTEAVRLTQTDVLRYLGDPGHVTVPVDALLDKSYGRTRAQSISLDRAMEAVGPGLQTGSDTVYFCVIDSEGNACSFVNSNYMNFGSGLVPKDCGFALQNRGANFSLRRGHPNCIAGGKRSYHTILCALLTDTTTDQLLAALGVMGAFMQPQGHVQALDAPRVYVHYDQKSTTSPSTETPQLHREIIAL
ncbi:hypothetical protein WMY93_025110 [Mugilogobius chulae]|uniref:Uncharacterized protein n=1 Tax=Mugilogobius chulae TaxID=88201 RepID=A0AAW0NC13_9GOBI